MKYKSKFIIVYIFLNLFYPILNANGNNNNNKNELINENYMLFVISLDGFRHDYLDRYSNENGFLRKLSKSGVRAYSESIFPSNTYPNHWTIVTGVWPSEHGIVNNDVYDPISKQHFRMARDNENSLGWFQQVEPIWILNEKINGKLRNKKSVVYDWPGAPAPFGFNKIQASTYRQIKYENWFINTFNDTIEKFVNSIERGKTNLAILYLGEPDMAGHLYGPESIQVENTVKELDYVLDYLFSLLKERKNYDIENDIDLIILTDHGMTTIREPNENAEKRHFYLSDYIDVEKYFMLDKCSYGSLSELWLKDEINDLDFVYQTLSNEIKSNTKIKDIYLKKDLPERFHLSKSNRVAPLMLLASKGYQIVLERNKGQKYSVTKYHGNHGYEPNDASMRGIFLANGKSFKSSYKSNDPIRLIDIYSLLCHILNVTANPNNGSFNQISHILRNEPYVSNNDDLLRYLLMSGIAFIIFLIFISFVLPPLLIFSSIKATCNTPNESFAKFQKNTKVFKKEN